MPIAISNCLITPTSIALDERSGTIFVTEIGTGNVVRLTVEGLANSPKGKQPSKK